MYSLIPHPRGMCRFIAAAGASLQDAGKSWGINFLPGGASRWDAKTEKNPFLGQTHFVYGILYIT